MLTVLVGTASMVFIAMIIMYVKNGQRLKELREEDAALTARKEQFEKDMAKKNANFEIHRLTCIKLALETERAARMLLVEKAIHPNLLEQVGELRTHLRDIPSS